MTRSPRRLKHNVREAVGEQVRDLPLHAVRLAMFGVGRALLLSDRLTKDYKELREGGVRPVVGRLRDDAQHTAEKVVTRVVERVRGTDEESATDDTPVATPPAKPRVNNSLAATPTPTKPEPSAAESTTTKPAATEAKPATPNAKPAATEPATAKPAAAKPEPAAEPTSAKPVTAETRPAATTAKSTTAKPETTADKATPAAATAKPATTKPQNAKPATAKPETAASNGKSATAKPATAKPAAAKAAQESEPAATPAPGVKAEISAESLPIPGYDEATLASLRARLRGLTTDQVALLRDYEQSHKARPEVVRMYENRIAKLNGTN